MKIAIVGSRDYPNLDKVRALVAQLPEKTRVVTGGAIGVDATAYEEAVKRGLKTSAFRKETRADQAMKVALYCDEMYVFWDGKCEDTRWFIDRGLQCGVLTKVYRPA